MASLLERMNVDPNGATRNKKTKNDRASPYNRNTPRGDSNQKWEHDLHNNVVPLEARLGPNTRGKSAPKLNTSGITAHLDASSPNSGRATRSNSNNSDPLSIKGASAPNVVDVRGLVAGTTADDVRAIFGQAGTITSAENRGSNNEPVVRITYKNPQSAKDAIAKYHGQTADGKTLSVNLVGIGSAGLGARIGGQPVVSGGSVDALLADVAGGSKLRSDAILASDSRAAVITTPAGQNPADYNAQTRGGRGRARGGRRGNNGRGGRGRKPEGGMDVD